MSRRRTSPIRKVSAPYPQMRFKYLSKFCTLFEYARLQLLDLKNIRFQSIYNQDMEELKKNIIIGKSVLEPKTFKFEILVCFWVTIHLELLEYA